MEIFSAKFWLGVILTGISVWTANGQSEYYGMTSHGGTYDAGIIYRTNFQGTPYEVLKEFSQGDGRNPVVNRLCEVAPDNLYGMTENGGSYGLGVIFHYTPSTRTYTKIMDFNGAENGSEPWGGLCMGSDGLLYGMTERGGTASMGVLFQLDPATNTFVKVLDFNGTENGAYPENTLISASNGKLYGMTSGGGTGMVGVIFEFDVTTHTFSKLAELTGLSDGVFQSGGFVEAPNGKLYGMTYSGGTGGFGVLFEFDPVSHNLQKKIDFDMTTMGAGPMGSLTLASDGLLYGLTVYGGNMNKGVLFAYNPATNMLTPRINFDGTTTGRSPEGGLVQAPDGLLYGMNPQGGQNNLGVLFQFDPADGTIVVKHNFNGTNTGSYPYGTPTLSSDGNIYGLTFRGGDENVGVIFSFSTETEILDKVYDFHGAVDGYDPKSGLTQAPDGNLYGVTSEGGLYGVGVLFQINPETGAFQKKADFNPGITGSNPQGSLVCTSTGELYGTTMYGGSAGYGTLFKFDPSENTLKKCVDYTGTDNGRNPNGSLMQASDGYLYGMTLKGGISNLGVLYRFNMDSQTMSKLFDFDGLSHGSSPYGGLFEASDGLLYGMTYDGGSSGLGIIFNFNRETGDLIKRFDFTSATGNNPYGSLVEAGDAKLYGMTSLGGYDGMGTLFSFDPVSGSYAKKLDFTGVTRGSNPYGDLMKASDGILYGMTRSGGYFDFGTIFSYNPASGYQYTMVNFNEKYGKFPMYGTLTEYAHAVPIPSGDNLQQFCHAATVALLQATGTDIKWYGSAEGQDLLQETDPLEDGFTYYASQTVEGVESSSRLEVNVVISNPAPPVGNDAQEFCNEGAVKDLEVTGTQVQWFDRPDGGSALNMDAPLVNNQSYYASQTEAGCESEARLMVTVTILAPAAPAGPATQHFCETALISDLTVTGTGIQWYDASTGGMAKDPAAAIQNGLSYYASQTVNGCESESRCMVTVSIEPNPEATVTRDGQTLTATAEDATYSWLDCDNGNTPVAGETEASFIVPGNGSFAVEVTRNGCSAVSECIEVVVTGFGADVKEESIVFPNPTFGSFRLNGNFSGQLYRIVDSKGKVIASGTLSGTPSTLSLEKENSGVFFLLIDGHAFKIIRL